MSEWIQVFKYVQIQEQNHMVSNHTISHDQANIQSPVPAGGSWNAGKPATKRINMLQTNQKRHEHTWTNQWYLIISHHQILISERWELRRRPSTSASRIISSTSSSVSFSSAEWYTHTSHSFCTPHGKSLHISRKFTESYVVFGIA